jgi:hypothetical protein
MTDTIDDMYRAVKTWDNLIDTNLLFVTGKIKETFYQYGPLNDETTEDPEFLQDIVRLNEKKIFTTGSQPFELDEQRSYIDVHCDATMGEKIFKRLLNNDLVHICYATSTSYFDNMHVPRLNLTRKKKDNESTESYNRLNCNYIPMTSKDGKWYEPTNWWKDNYIDDDGQIQDWPLESIARDSFPIIADLMHDTTNMMIVAKSFTEELSAPKVLLDCVDAINNDE